MTVTPAPASRVSLEEVDCGVRCWMTGLTERERERERGGGGREREGGREGGRERES